LDRAHGSPLSSGARETLAGASISSVHDEVQDETDHNNQSNDVDNVVHFPRPPLSQLQNGLVKPMFHRV
jgi:hypothetical protein